MTQPIELKIDYEAEASYIRYRALTPGTHVAHTEDVLEDGSVTVDRDEQGNVLGIELLGFSPTVIGNGLSFANRHDLEFPRALLDTPTETASGMPASHPQATVPGKRLAPQSGHWIVRLRVFSDSLNIFRKPGGRV